MKFGVFDHLDAAGVPLVQQYEDRLRLIERYERSGIHAYHVAEHHATPLGMSPSPSVFLSAVAQRTRRLLFGPLVYTLPLYHPLRVAEEICMLDHLSNGRLQVGVGRGISPFETNYYGIDPQQSQARYIEAFAVMMKALTSDTLDHEGTFYRYRQVPIVLRPLQQPHPPLWYGVGNPEGVDWCVANRINAVVNGSLQRVREITDRYRSEWARAGHAAAELPLIGTSRHVVIADTDEQAVRIARRAYAQWFDSFMMLWRRHGAEPQFAGFPSDLDGAREQGLAAVGSPATVREVLTEQIERSGVNYLLCRFAFGDLSYAESARSIDLFVDEIMPGLTQRFAAVA